MNIFTALAGIGTLSFECVEEGRIVIGGINTVLIWCIYLIKNS
jgi:hypothetical protein